MTATGGGVGGGGGGGEAGRSARFALREPLGLYAFALVVRAAVAAMFPHPGYPDSSYYVEVARNVAAGRGFSVDFLWTFLEVGGTIPAVPHLPVPSNPHWAPLASIVQVPFTWLLGPSPVAALTPFILIGALAAPLAWVIARDAGAARPARLGAGFLGAVPAAATVFAAQPENVSLTMVLGGGALWLSARGLRGDSRSFVVAGLLAGLATLARTDGLLLASGPAAAFLLDRWRCRRGSGGRRPEIPWRAAIACAGLFVLVVAPWYARQLAVFGSLTPSSSAGVLWLRSFADLNSVTADRSLDAFLGQGAGAVLATRLTAFLQACAVFVVIVCGIVLAPLAARGLWVRRRSGRTAEHYGPWLVAGAVVFAVSSTLFAIHVPNGLFLHASIALAPHTYVLAMEGLAAVAGAIAGHGGRAARRSGGAEALPGSRPQTARSTRDPGAAERLLVVATCGVVAAIAAFGVATTQSTWSDRRAIRIELASALDRAGAGTDDRVMSADSAGMRYVTGHGGIVSPDDPLDVIGSAACAYGVRWLALERAGAVPALAPLLDGAARPAWLGEPVVTVTVTGGSAATADGDDAGTRFGPGTASGADTAGATPPVAAALFPVVLSACSAGTSP